VCVQCRAHQGVVNRDIKLENTLLDASPKPLVKITDFGYCKSDKESLPKSKVGTPGYTGARRATCATGDLAQCTAAPHLVERSAALRHAIMWTMRNYLRAPTDKCALCAQVEALRRHSRPLTRHGACCQPCLHPCAGMRAHAAPPAHPCALTGRAARRAAPEVICAKTHYDGEKADIWSCGVMVYVMLFCEYPFERPEDDADKHGFQKARPRRVGGARGAVPVAQLAHSMLGSASRQSRTVPREARELQRCGREVWRRLHSASGASLCQRNVADLLTERA